MFELQVGPFQLSARPLYTQNWLSATFYQFVIQGRLRGLLTPVRASISQLPVNLLHEGYSIPGGMGSATPFNTA